MKVSGSSLRPVLGTLVGCGVFAAVAACGSDSKDDATPAPTSGTTILDLAAGNKDLSTLAALVTLCKLDGALKDASAKTVFAPTNAAFSAVFAELPKTCSDSLATTLKYHVIGVKIPSSKITNTETTVASLGGNLFVKKQGKDVVINNSAKVVSADVEASNGVVHVVDKVLIPDSLGTVVDIASKRDGFSTLVSLVKLCDLAGALSKGTSTLTVFAPTNAAFTTYLNGAAAPTSCGADLKNTLLYHVLGAKVLSTDLMATQAPQTLLTGNSLFVTKASAGVKVNASSSVAVADLQAGNGVVHVIDKVLVPDAQGTVVDALAKRYDYTSLVGAVVSAKLVDILQGTGPFTVFAPNNAAFTDIASTVASLSAANLAKVLTHHVLPSKVLAANIAVGITNIATVEGSQIKISNTAGKVLIRGSSAAQQALADAAAPQVTETDILTKNGVIHAVNAVLLPTL